MPAFNWLHLTDLHYGLGGQPPLWPNIREAFFKDLSSQHDRCGPWHAVLFTGDLVQAGKPDEFKSMQADVLEPLVKHLRDLGSNPVLLAVPGNHDLVRADTRSAALRWLLQPGGYHDIVNEFWNEPTGEYRRIIDSCFANYTRWWQDTDQPRDVAFRNGILPGDFSATLNAGGLSIGVVGLNTTFLQLGPGDYIGRLAWDVRQFNAACTGNPNGDAPGWINDHSLCILLTHQGPECLDQQSRDKVYPEINPAGRFAVHLYGHMHENVVRSTSVGGGNTLRQWQGTSLFSREPWGDPPRMERRHGYAAGQISVSEDHAVIRHWPRKAVQGASGWRFVPDHDSCVLQDDTGTAPETIAIQLRETVSVGARNGQAASGSSKKPLFVHRYTLLDTRLGLIGRKSWLSTLDRWLAEPRSATILTLHAIGGSGKSALAWTWFNQQFMSRADLAGGLWYCFYEPGASFGDFLRHLYSYVLGVQQPFGGVRQALGNEEFIPLFDRLRDQRFLIVLDGFERLLKAYVREQSAHGPQADLGRNAELTLERERELCQGMDENVNHFLTALDQPLASRLLVTSRLVPAATRNTAGQERPHNQILRLDALDPDDVMRMMEAYGVRGTRETILRIMASFGHHALLVKLIAAMVAKDKAHVGDFDAWLSDHPGFEPTKLTITENRVHVLDYAIRRLTNAENNVLIHAAALRSAATYKDLRELLVGADPTIPHEDTLSKALTTLDELKLVEWDRDQNTYDLHPLVRNTVWLRASSAAKEAVDERIVQEFSEYPAASEEPNHLLLERHQDVYFALIRRGRYDDAWRFLNEKNVLRFENLFVGTPTTTVITLLVQLFTSEYTDWPRLTRREDRRDCLLALALAYEFSGDEARALDVYARHRPICDSETCLGHQARILGGRGKLIESEHIERQLLTRVRQGANHQDEITLLKTLAGSMRLRGQQCHEAASRRIARLFRQLPLWVNRAEVLNGLFCFRCDLAAAQARQGNKYAVRKWQTLAQRWLQKSQKSGDVLDQANALLQLASVHTKREDFDSAYEAAEQAVEIAQQCGWVGFLIGSLWRLATAALKLDRAADAERVLGQAIELAERSDSKIWLSDLRLLQAKLAARKGNADLAVDFAREAYVLAWCDGPPFSDSESLHSAKEFLDQMRQPVPVGLPVRTVPPDWIEIALDPPKTEAEAADIRSRPTWESASPAEAKQMLYVPSPENDGLCEVDRLIRRSRESLDIRNYEQAEHWASMALEYDPRGDDCWKARAKTRWYCGDLDNAVRDYAEAIALLPATDTEKRASYLAERGHVYVALNQASEALQDLGAALEIIPPEESGDAWGAKGLALALLGRSKEAGTAFRIAMRKSPDNARIYFYLGRARTLRQNRKSALVAFQRALTLLEPPLAPWMEREARRFLDDESGE